MLTSAFEGSDDNTADEDFNHLCHTLGNRWLRLELGLDPKESTSAFSYIQPSMGALPKQ